MIYIILVVSLVYCGTEMANLMGVQAKPCGVGRI